MTITLYDLTGPQNHKRSFTYSESSSYLPTRPEWHDEAACKGMPTALFFSSADADKEQAIEVCSGCPVKDHCAQSQRDNGDRDGTWGGVSYEDNRKRRKSPPRKPIEHGTNRGYQLHWARGERACDECREAATAARRDRYWLSKQEREIGSANELSRDEASKVIDMLNGITEGTVSISFTDEGAMTLAVQSTLEAS